MPLNEHFVFAFSSSNHLGLTGLLCLCPPDNLFLIARMIALL